MGDTKFLIPWTEPQSVAILWKAVESLWCCLIFSFTQFVILEDLSSLDLALSGVKGLKENVSLVT